MRATKKPGLVFDLNVMDKIPQAVAAPEPAKRAKKPKAIRQKVGTTVMPATYQQLKLKAAISGEKIQNLMEQAITEFLANHPN